MADFKCINLTAQKAEITPLEKCLAKIKTGFHAFYTCECWITGIQLSVGGSPDDLRQVFNQQHTVKELLIQNDMGSKLTVNPDSCPLVLIPTLSASRLDEITTFFQVLRNILSGVSSNDGSNFSNQPGFSLNQAASWDLCLERERHSGLIPNAHDYHEYLLWDSGGWHNQDTLHDKDVWCGCGWISSRLQSNINKSPEWCLPKLGEWANKSMDELSRAIRNLTSFYQNQEETPYNLEEHGNFIRTLCEFLPYHKSRHTDSNKYIPSNMMGERGGPMRWRGLLDDRLYLRKRHLLMDGWLTLWPVTQQDGTTELFVQPGSLGLLYWAARKADMPYTDTPENFLENYDWQDNPNWFGGKWERCNSVSK